MAAVELWEWEDGDGQQVDVQLHEDTGRLELNARDLDGDVTCVQLSARSARALGVALMNGTAPWAGR